MKEFNNQNLKTIRQEIDNALATVAKKNGIALSIGRITYDGTSFRTKLEAAVVGANTSGVSLQEVQMKNALRDYGSMFGVSEKDYGKTFISNGSRYTLIGLKPSRPKYPVIGMSERGARYKFPEGVLAQIKNKK